MLNKNGSYSNKVILWKDQGVAKYVWLGKDCTVIFDKSDVATSR